MKDIIFITMALLQLFFNYSFAQNNSSKPFYDLKVRISPESGNIECRAEIQNSSDTCFILNKDMVIHNISSGGIPVPYTKKDANLFPNSAEFKIKSHIPKVLVIDYSGEIKNKSYPSVIGNVNMIKPGLVELALYVSWYPRLLNNMSSFDFHVNIDLPSNYVTITNGFLKEEKIENGRRLTNWRSFNPSNDILILAAPNLKESDISKDGTKIEIYYDKLPDTYIDSMKNNLIKSVNYLTDLLGPSKSDQLIRIGYSPRPAWGYVRAPFIVVSEINALYGRTQKFGMARDFRYITHEIAHYWWSFANTSTPDDWINEGLAEYSAFLVSKDIIGKDFTDQLLNEYNEKADNSSAETAIAETENNSPDREVNRYAKPVIIFNEAEKRFGSEIMQRFYRNLYERLLKPGDATTEVFLDEVKKDIGAEAYQYFSAALNKKKWKEKTLNTTNTYVKADTIFFGTWNGVLVQMDMKMKVVLHIMGKDGMLEAKTDSPDQGVKDIPISEIKINGDSLLFKLGAASAAFEGTLDRNKMIISGQWLQAGSAYPLSLYKNN